VDIATIIGLVAAFGLIIGSILTGGSLTSFLDVPSMMIVIGGTFGVGLISFPMARVLSAMKVAINVFRYEVPDISEQNAQIIEFADTARKEGILSLEGSLSSIEDDFMKRGVQLLVDGIEPEKIEDLMYDELEGMETRHGTGAQIFETFASSAPALGLVGTLIGLVNMLQNMEDPSAIGPAMAVALLTTFYGALLANVVFTPVAGKLRIRHQEELQAKALVVKGLMGIARGENPRILAQQLEVELPPSQRSDNG
jgi:chemotaxis protein MotA